MFFWEDHFSLFSNQKRSRYSSESLISFRVEHSRYEIHIETLWKQRKARNAPSRELWVPWAGSLWHKRAGVVTLWATHFITIWNNLTSMTPPGSVSQLVRTHSANVTNINTQSSGKLWQLKTKYVHYHHNNLYLSPTAMLIISMCIF